MKVSEEPLIRKRFSDAVARRIYPAMARAGLRRQGKRTWREHRADDSWVVIEIQMSKWTTRTELGFTVNLGVWPPGTWAYCVARTPMWQDTAPDASATAPIWARPDLVAPALWPWHDFREVDLTADFDQVVDETLRFMLTALEWGRAHSDVDTAADFLTRPYDVDTHRHGPRLELAVAMLDSVAPGHPRLPELVEALTHTWVADPRPITLRGQIEQWRARCGLPPVDNLPWYWHPAMMKDWVDRFGWPDAAYLAAPDSQFYLADGSMTTTPPPDWPRKPRGWRPSARS